MWDVGIAKMLKERDNKNQIGPCVGNVTSINPLIIDILNGEISLQENQMYIVDNLINLEINNKVLVIPAEFEQVFFIVNKVRKVGE